MEIITDATKRCTRCGTEKARGEFGVLRKNADGLIGHCRECLTSVRHARERGYEARQSTATEKLCPCCKQVKSAGEFYKAKSTPTGLQVHCIECRKQKVKDRYPHRQAYQVRYHAANREYLRKKHRDYRLQKDFGITRAEYWQLFERQCGVCGVCQQPNPTGDESFSVDHDHKTGRVRGLLCTKCNWGLGMLGDTEAGLSRALEYIVGRAMFLASNPGD